MTTDVATLDDARLFAAEDGLHRMFVVRKDAYADTSDIEEAFALVANEMARRGLIFDPLAKATKAKPRVEPKHFGADDDGDDDDTNRDDADPDNDGGTSRNPSPDTNTGDRGKAHGTSQSEGPWVKKDSLGFNDDADEDPDMHDENGKADSAKGVTSDDDGLRIKGKKAPKNKGGDSAAGRTTEGNTKADSAKGVTADDDGRWVKKGYNPHQFKKGDDGDCRTCGGAPGDHVAKAVGTDGSIFKAVSDDTLDDRKSGAESGHALPDGSFYIPDEAHLHQAIRLVGQAPDPQAAMNHIIERAQAMGLESALPPAWRAMTAAGMPGEPQVGPGANSQAAQMGAATPPGAPGSKAQVAPGAAPTPPKKSPGLAKRIAAAVSKALTGEGVAIDDTSFEEIEKALIELDADFEYAIVKSRTEDRYTLGPVYMPDTLDAHGEWATAEDLQKSMWDYVRETGDDRKVFLQHSDKPAGEWVEIMSWPQEVTARMTKSVDGIAKAVDTTFPAGTAYMGVIWEPWAFTEVKKGNITGFSMGGSARRVEGAPSA